MGTLDKYILEKYTLEKLTFSLITLRKYTPSAETKFKNKWTLFFELFDLSEHYIFEHLSLHIHFRAFKPSYTFSWVRGVLPETKLKNKWTLFFEFERPLHF